MFWTDQQSEPMRNVWRETRGRSACGAYFVPGDWSALDDLYLDRCVQSRHGSHVLPRLEPAEESRESLPFLRAHQRHRTAPACCCSWRRSSTPTIGWGRSSGRTPPTTTRARSSSNTSTSSVSQRTSPALWKNPAADTLELMQGKFEEMKAEGMSGAALEKA